MLRASLIFFLLTVSAMAQQAPTRTGTVPGAVTPLGYCALSVGASAVGLSSCAGGIPAGAIFAYITPETAAVRYRDDGTAPTATVGYPVSPGQQLTYGGPMSAVQFIAQSGTSTLDVLFEK